MQLRRILAVAALIIALGGLIATQSADAQTEVSSPTTGTPTDPLTGLPHVPVEMNELVMSSPACLDCYLGLWQITLEGEGWITLPALGTTMTAYLVRGTIALDPGSPSFLEPPESISGTDMFLWPPDAEVTVTNASSSDVFIFLIGITNGRDSIAMQAVDSDGIAAIIPLGGSAFNNPGVQDIAILVGKFKLKADQAFALAPAEWPLIMDMTTGTPYRSVGMASLPAGLTPVQVTKIDELDPGVRVLLPSTASIITVPPFVSDSSSPDPVSPDPAFIWLFGVENRTPGSQPGCGGWRCAVSAPAAA